LQKLLPSSSEARRTNHHPLASRRQSLLIALMNESLFRAVEDRRQAVVSLTQDLIRFPTVNPPGEA